MSTYFDSFRQCFFIPTPPLTEKNLPSQSGKVFIVTGGYAGVGKELSKILYQADATVYVAGRSSDKGNSAIEEIKEAHPSSKGRLEYLQLDLADLPTIKGSAEDFLRREQRLDVLTNNAGVMTPPVGSKSTQGYELQMGTNVLGPWLFTHFLTPLLQKTASSSPAGSVRVTWAASLVTMMSPKEGVVFETDGQPKVHGDPRADYAQSKASNVLLSREFSQRYGDSIISNAWNPGNLKSELHRHMPVREKTFAVAISHESIYGAYTELFAACSEEAGKKENEGKYIVPWGRFGALRGDLLTSQMGPQLWEWCEKETKQYL